MPRDRGLLALLRDAALVGGYLDGIEYAKPASCAPPAGRPVYWARSEHGGV